MEKKLSYKSEYKKGKGIKNFFQDIDYELISGLQKIRTKIGNYFWKFWTLAGYPYIWMAVGIIFTFLDIYHVSWVILISGLSSLYVIFPIKGYLKRRRPYDKHSDLKPLKREREHDYSFPSGHTYFCTVVGVSLALCYGGFISLFLMLGLGIMVGVSRVYLGVHYPTDVAAAFFMGIGVAFIIYFCFPLIMILHELTFLIKIF